MNATSTGITRERMRPGISERKTGHPVGPALVHRLPHVRAGEERAVAEGARVARVDVVGGAEGQDVRHLDVAQLAGAADQRLHQLLRVVAAGVQPDVVARADAAVTASSAGVTLRR